MRIPVLPTLAAIALTGLTACPSALSHTSARTLEQGSTEVTVALGGMSSTHDYSPPVLPVAEFQVRHGIGDRVELGGSLGPSGAGVRMKLGLVRSESESSGFNLSVEPGATVLPALYGAFFTTLQFPVHLGLLVGGNELRISPQVVYQLHPDSGPTLYAGSSIGYALRVGDSIHVTPEFGLLIPVGETDPTYRAQMVPTFGVGFTWGR